MSKRGVGARRAASERERKWARIGAFSLAERPSRWLGMASGGLADFSHLFKLVAQRQLLFVLMSKAVAKRSSRLWLAVGVVVCLHTLCYQAAAPLRRSHALALVTNDRLSSIAKRSFDPPPDPYSTFNLDPTEDDDSDPPHEDAESLIDYMRLWENATPKAKPLIFAAMVVWLIFLFAFVGITASDFFCPNLSTISTRLGMSESVVRSPSFSGRNRNGGFRWRARRKEEGRSL